MEPDSALVRVRKARMQISEECGHDPKKLIDYFMNLQQRHRDRLVWAAKTPLTDTAQDSTAGGKEP